MTRSVKGADGKIRLKPSHDFTGDAAEDAIDFHTDKVMMAAVKNKGMDLATLKLLSEAVGVWNVVVALDHMKGDDLLRLSKRIGVENITFSSNDGMRKAIIKLAGLDDDKREGEDYVFSHGLIFVGMRKKPSAFPGQKEAIKKAMQAYEKAKRKDAEKDQKNK